LRLIEAAHRGKKAKTKHQTQRVHVVHTLLWQSQLAAHSQINLIQVHWSRT
jgi:hypothetical protein